MSKRKLVSLLVLAVFVLSGCVVRSYKITKERTDQDLSSGNRGYLMGTPPPAPKREVKPRTSRVFEIELHPLFKTEEMPVEEEVAPQAAMVEESVVEDTWQEEGYVVDSAVEEVVEPQGAIEKYTVEKGDTLQKISQKFYGTTRKWQMLFEVNKDKLKAPDKIYPGQVIDIPVESAIKAKVK